MNIILIRLKMLESDVRKFKCKTSEEVEECGRILEFIEKHSATLKRLISEREEMMWPNNNKNQ